MGSRFSNRSLDLEALGIIFLHVLEYQWQLLKLSKVMLVIFPINHGPCS